MADYLKKIISFISGRARLIPSQRQITLVTIASIGLFHAMLLCLFAYFKVDLMMYVNIISVMIYLVSFVIVKKGGSVLACTRLCYAEVLIHVLLACIAVNFECGFQFYLMVLSTHSFYSAYVFRKEKKMHPFCYVLASVVVFVIIWLWTSVFDPLYSFEQPWAVDFFYILNFFTAVTACILFMSTFVLIIINMESLLTEKNEKLEELSVKDPLTGLVNRRSVEERHRLATLNMEHYAVIISDIDDFKMVNDTYGHDVGDLVLKAVADVFQESVREKDMVCRWGGEEILVFLPKCDAAMATVVANRVLNNVRLIHEHPVYGEIPPITMTFGVADSFESKSFREVVKMADARLYEGKSGGKNCVIAKPGYSGSVL